MRAIRILGGRKKSAPTIAEQKVLGRTLCWVEQDTYYGRVGVMTCATHRLFFDDGSAEEVFEDRVTGMWPTLMNDSITDPDDRGLRLLNERLGALHSVDDPVAAKIHYYGWNGGDPRWWFHGRIPITYQETMIELDKRE